MGQDFYRNNQPAGRARTTRAAAGVEALEPRTLLSAATFASARYPIPPFTREFVTADFNNDGKPDIAAVNTADGTILILLNNANGTFTRMPSLHAYVPRAIAVADFNHDGNVDLAVTASNGTNAVLEIFFGLGNGTFETPPAHYPIYSGAAHLIAVDLNGDGFADLVSLHQNRIGVNLNLGDGAFAPTAFYEVGGYLPNFVVSADFNNDGLPDLAISRGVPGGVTILTNNPAAPGTFGAPAIFPAGANPIGLAVGDFNHDGNQDLAVINSGFQVAPLSILLGNGDGTFRPRSEIGGPNFSDAIIAGDFNGDGNTDLVVGSFVSQLQLYSGLGNGAFAPPVALGGAHYAEFLQAADLNGDGKPDIVALPGALKVLINTTGAAPAPTPTAEDQTISAGAARSFTYTGPDGIRGTVTLTGPGAATLHLLAGTSAADPQGLVLSSITATGTTADTTLSINGPGAGRTLDVRTISTDGAFKAIQAASANLTGDLSVPGGIRNLILRSANNGSLTLGGAASSVTTLAMGQTNGETITSAGSFDSVTVSLDAGINLTATAIGTLSVGQTLHDSSLTIAGGITSLVARRGILNTTVKAAGPIGIVQTAYVINSTIESGVNPLPAGQSLPTAPTDFSANSAIGSVLLGRASGTPAFSNSVIAAATVGNLSLGTIETANDRTPFGVAAGAIGSVSGTIAAPRRGFRLTHLTSAQQVASEVAARGLILSDFTIRLVE